MKLGKTFFISFQKPFCCRENKSLKFQIFKTSKHHQMTKQKKDIHFTEIWPVYIIL